MSASPEPTLAPLWAALAAAVVGAVFACADAALTSLSPARLGAMAEHAAPAGRTAIDRAIARRPALQARYVLGRLCSLGAAVALFTWWLTASPAPLLAKTLWAAGGLLVLGAFVQGATQLGRRSADRMVMMLVPALRPLELLLAPFATVTRDVGRLIAPELGSARNPRLSETEVELMVDEGQRTGTLPPQPAELIRNVLEFSELLARDAMVPRTRVVSLAANLPIEQAFAIVSESGHSRFPVHGDDPDEVIGLLRAKDLFRVLGPVVAIGSAERTEPGPGPTDITVGQLARSPVKVIYESQPLSVVLQEMKQGRHHLAIVVNEFGAFIGIVTLEDVVEEIVGEIRDEHDAEEAPIVELGDGRLVADATVLLSDLSAYLGTSLEKDDAEADSLGGMITEELGRVPTTGTSLMAQGMRFVVREADEKRVLRVEIVRPVRASLFPAGSRGSEPPLTGAGARASNPPPNPDARDLAPLGEEMVKAAESPKRLEP